MMRSRMSWEVAVEAKEKVLPESLEVSSSSAALFSGMAAAAAAAVLTSIAAEGLEGVRALESWRAEALHDRDRNSMGPRGLSGSGSSPFGPFSAHNMSIFALVLLYMMNWCERQWLPKFAFVLPRNTTFTLHEYVCFIEIITVFFYFFFIFEKRE